MSNVGRTILHVKFDEAITTSGQVFSVVHKLQVDVTLIESYGVRSDKYNFLFCEQTMSNRPKTIFVDVDNTLIRTVGQSRIPITQSVEFVRRMYDAGNNLVCWSRGGADYSQNIAEELEIAQCFTAFLPKPDILLDDNGTDLLNHCEFIHPLNAANH